MEETWTDELAPSMMPNGICRRIAEEIGMENFLKLSDLIGGTTFYLPKRSVILRPLRYIKICEEFNGSNFGELARKYKITQRWVRVIVGKQNEYNSITSGRV